VQRLAAWPGWDRGPWLRIRHRGLVRRLERWALLDAFADRRTLVIDRLGVVRWPTYTCTAGTGLHRDRRALSAWERLLRPLDAEEALAALVAGTARAPGRLDLRRLLAELVRERARALERVDPAAAAELYARLDATGAVPSGRIAVRWARAVERAGRAAEALAVLRRARQGPARPSEQVAIGRAGRRLARALRTGFAPAPPLAPPRIRSLRLEPADPHRGRPRWTTAHGPQHVERAVGTWLAELGRRAIRAEAAPWATLFALLCAELYFLPVDGALPVPYLPGPLDLGTPRFRAARADACRALLDDLRAGAGPERIRAAWPRWEGLRLAGARWDSADAEVLATLAEGIGPAGLCALVGALLDHGPRAAAGLPDLVVLPGPEIRLPDALPARVGPGLLLVEIKGPTDALRDEQLVWHDRLTRAQAPIEVWEVGPPPQSGRTGSTLR
jgi:hypothetical protein